MTSAKKRQLLEQLLDKGMVMIVLDARRSDVDVPKHLRHDGHLRLNLSYRFGTKLEVSESLVTSSLSFSGTNYECHLPWSSIYLIVSHVSGQPYLFTQDVPADLLARASENLTSEAENTPQPAKPEPEPPLKPTKHPHLRLVK